MKKEKLNLWIFLLAYFAISFVFLSQSYTFFKKQIILNNEMIIGTVLQSDANKVSEVVAALKEEKFTSSHVLAKYGLENLESLDYLPSMKKVKRDYFLWGIFIIFISAFFFSFLLPLSRIFSLYSFILYPQKLTPCLLLNICVFLFNSNSRFLFKQLFIFSNAYFASSFVFTIIMLSSKYLQ